MNNNGTAPINYAEAFAMLAKMTAVPIPRYEGTSTDALRSFKMNVPCILTNTNLVNPAVQNWSLSYLNKNLPEATEWTVLKSTPIEETVPPAVSSTTSTSSPSSSTIPSSTSHPISHGTLRDVRLKVTKHNMRFHSFVSELERSCTNDDGHIPFQPLSTTVSSSSTVSAPSPSSSSSPTDTLNPLPPETGKIRPLLQILAHTQTQIHNYAPDVRGMLKDNLYDSLHHTQMIHASVNSETTNFSLQAIKPAQTGTNDNRLVEIPSYLKNLDFSSKHSVPDLVYLQQNLHVYIGNRILNDCKAFNYNYLHSVQRFADWGDLCGNILYIHQKGTITPCHNDELNNLYCQIKGKKLFLLASPRYYSSLYPAPVNHPIDRQSFVNIRCPNLQQYPKFTETQFLYCTLEPGEVLYIPSSWFHYSETPYEDSLSLNFWFFHNIPPPNMSSPPSPTNTNSNTLPSVTVPSLTDDTTTINKGSKARHPQPEQRSSTTNTGEGGKK